MELLNQQIERFEKLDREYPIARPFPLSSDTLLRRNHKSQVFRHMKSLPQPDIYKTYVPSDDGSMCAKCNHESIIDIHISIGQQRQMSPNTDSGKCVCHDRSALIVSDDGDSYGTVECPPHKFTSQMEKLNDVRHSRHRSTGHLTSNRIGRATSGDCRQRSTDKISEHRNISRPAPRCGQRDSSVIRKIINVPTTLSKNDNSASNWEQNDPGRQRLTTRNRDSRCEKRNSSVRLQRTSEKAAPKSEASRPEKRNSSVSLQRTTEKAANLPESKCGHRNSTSRQRSTKPIKLSSSSASKFEHLDARSRHQKTSEQVAHSEKMSCGVAASSRPVSRQRSTEQQANNTSKNPSSRFGQMDSSNGPGRASIKRNSGSEITSNHNRIITSKKIQSNSVFR
eukprot:GHVL01025616.1.p1 GENE.GHVL01025616.1~~GHVL01025616.1.p1  ORF type:complete len:395 (+),score=46.88 GHVL01025616.1:739-1923(+)